MSGNRPPASHNTEDLSRYFSQKRRKFNPPGTVNYTLREEADQQCYQDSNRPALMTQERGRNYTRPGMMAEERDRNYNRPGMMAEERERNPNRPGMMAEERDRNPNRLGIMAEERDRNYNRPGMIIEERDRDTIRTGMMIEERDRDSIRPGMMIEERDRDSNRPGMMTEELMNTYVTNMERIAKSLHDEPMEVNKYSVFARGESSRENNPTAHALSACLFEDDLLSSSSMSVSNASHYSRADQNVDDLGDICFYNHKCPTGDLREEIDERCLKKGGDLNLKNYISRSQIISTITYENDNTLKINSSNLQNGDGGKMTPVISKYVNNKSNSNLKKYLSSLEEPGDDTPPMYSRVENENRCSFPSLPRRDDNENRCSFSTVTNSSFSSIPESYETMRDEYGTKSDLMHNISSNEVDLLNLIKSISPIYVDELISSVNSLEDNNGGNNISPIRADHDNSRHRNEDSPLNGRDGRSNLSTAGFEERSLNAKNKGIDFSAEMKEHSSSARKESNSLSSNNRDSPFGGRNRFFVAYNTSQSSYNSEKNILKDELKSTFDYEKDFVNNSSILSVERRVPFISTPEEVQQSSCSSNTWQADYPSSQRNIERASMLDSRYKAAMHDDRYNASTQDGRYNASMQDDRYNRSMQDDRLISSMQDDRFIPSIRSDRYNTSIQGNVDNPLTQENQFNALMQNVQFNVLVEDDQYKELSSDLQDSKHHVTQKRKNDTCINRDRDDTETPAEKKDATFTLEKTKERVLRDSGSSSWDSTRMSPTREVEMLLPAYNNKPIEAKLTRSNVNPTKYNQPPIAMVAEGESKPFVFEPKPYVFEPKPYVFTGNSSNSRTSSPQVRIQEDSHQYGPSYSLIKDNCIKTQCKPKNPYIIKNETNISATCSTESAGIHQKRVSGHMNIPSRDVPVSNQSLKSILKQRPDSRAYVDTDSTSFAVNKTDSDISLLTNITEQCKPNDDNTRPLFEPLKSLPQREETNDQQDRRMVNSTLNRRNPGPYTLGTVPMRDNTYNVIENTDTFLRRNVPKTSENVRDQTQGEVVNNTIIVQMGRKGRYASRSDSKPAFNVDERFYSTVNGVKVPISEGTIWKYKDTHRGNDQLDMSVTVSTKDSGFSLYSSDTSCATPVTSSESETSMKKKTFKKPVYSYSSSSSSNISDEDGYKRAPVRRRNNRSLKQNIQINKVKFDSDIDEDIPTKHHSSELSINDDGTWENDVTKKESNQNIVEAYTFRPESFKTAQRDDDSGMVNSRPHWSLKNKVTAWAARLSAGRHTAKESEAVDSASASAKNTTHKEPESSFWNASPRHSWPTSNEVGSWASREAFERAGGVWPSQDDSQKESSPPFKRDFFAFRQSSCNDVKRENSKSTTNVGGGVKETKWAITQVTIFNDGSKTYSVTQPTKMKPLMVPAKIVRVFVTVPRKRREKSVS